jgi:hypothetical protein
MFSRSLIHTSRFRCSYSREKQWTDLAILDEVCFCTKLPNKIRNRLVLRVEPVGSMFFGSGTRTRLMKFFWTQTRTRSGSAPGLTNFNQPGSGLTILISRVRVQKSWTRRALVLNFYPLAQNVGSATAYCPDLKSKLIAVSVPSWVNWIRLPFTSSLTYGNHRYNKNNVKNWI